MTEAVLFWILAVLAVIGGIGVIASRRAMYSAMSLVWTLFCLASLYVLLRAHLLAALQVLVYAGAIMMLFVFVVMLLSMTDEEKGKARASGYGIAGSLAAGTILVGVAFAVAGQPSPEGPLAVGTVRAVALELYTEHVLAFQVTAVLLLAAIIGATVVAIRRI